MPVNTRNKPTASRSLALKIKQEEVDAYIKLAESTPYLPLQKNVTSATEKRKGRAPKKCADKNAIKIAQVNMVNEIERLPSPERSKLPSSRSSSIKRTLPQPRNSSKNPQPKILNQTKEDFKKHFEKHLCKKNKQLSLDLKMKVSSLPETSTPVLKNEKNGSQKTQGKEPRKRKKRTSMSARDKELHEPVTKIKNELGPQHGYEMLGKLESIFQFPKSRKIIGRQYANQIVRNVQNPVHNEDEQDQHFGNDQEADNYVSSDPKKSFHHSGYFFHTPQTNLKTVNHNFNIGIYLKELDQYLSLPITDRLVDAIHSSHEQQNQNYKQLYNNYADCHSTFKYDNFGKENPIEIDKEDFEIRNEFFSDQYQGESANGAISSIISKLNNLSGFENYESASELIKSKIKTNGTGSANRGSNESTFFRKLGEIFLKKIDESSFFEN